MPRLLKLVFPLTLWLACAPTSPAPASRPTPPPTPAQQVVSSSAVKPDAVPATMPSSPLTDETACAMVVSGTGAPRPAARAFAGETGDCLPDHPFCDSAEIPPTGADACFVADQNISRAERAVRAGQPQPRPAGSSWDGTTPPKYLDRIDAHLHLTPAEHAMLRSNGFVVLDRLAYTNYANAFHDIFQEQLPLYVGIDPILHAVFRGTESALQRIETARLRPAQARLLTRLRAALSRSKDRYDEVTRNDLDVYLGVAWSLAELARDDENSPPVSLFGQDDAVVELAQQANNATGLEDVELFGRTRVIDFSQLVPRGHYVAGPDPSGDLSAYFRATMWLSRLEFNLVSRGCRSSQPGAVPNPSETPREARDAMALADLIERAGVGAELRAFEDVYSAFAGRREDIPPAEVSRLMHSQHILLSDREASDKLKTAIGDGYRRTARIHFMPEGSGELPAIMTLLGPRIVPDVAPLTRLVHDAIPDRMSLGAADVAFLLGHDRASNYLAPDLNRYPTLRPSLDHARSELKIQTDHPNNVYGTWLRAVLALAAEPAVRSPSFMHKPAYADARMNSALVGYGQLRHAFVLLAAQGYDAYGCEIPDAYVEPLPEVYQALNEHVRQMRAQSPGWSGLQRVLGTLQGIVRSEVSGAALSEAQRRWLAMVSENVPVGGYSDSGQPPKWTGWYFDMFDDREHGANRTSAFIADYFTLTNNGVVAYLGAGGPRLAVFIVDVGGEPRAMVGPVAPGYETQAPIATRLDDEQAMSYQPREAAWRAGFAAPAGQEPELGLQGRTVRCENGQGPPEWRVVIRSERPVASAQLTLLDHHADPLTMPLEIAASREWKAYAFALPEEIARSRWGVEALHLRVNSGATWDFFTSPSAYQSSEETPQQLPTRPRGIEAFAVGGPLPALPPTARDAMPW